MRIKVEVEGKINTNKIEDIFTALETNKINVTKSQKLQQIEEIKELKQEIKQEVENTLGEKIHIEELVITKTGTYFLKGKIEK
ncbi:conserved lipothrixviral protein [Sulfolobus islandicus filamentous virus 2]|uniref:Conserved lipothrixviral protein n=1 Tax=Sulfolobus islandicus filamentous virus 2 TaxID=1902331 RepID=A0A1D8BJ53_SIFV|nr:conserved lipothrixviral protein [Sulfolobus islandicus filamentous virus 2]